MGASSVRRWLKHFKDGNTDFADQPRRSRLRTTATERNKQKVDELIRQDRRITFREILAQLGVGHYAVREMMEIFICRKVCSRWVLRFLTGKEIHKMAGNSHPRYSPDLAPSDYHLFGTLKDHLTGHHYETDEAVHEAMRSWLRGAGTDFYCRGVFKILHWQKCIDRDRDFVEE
jgi:hypothetical protein